MNRREAIQAAGAALVTAALPLETSATEPASASKGDQSAAGQAKTIAMLVYPGFTALDLVGPHHVFSALEGYKVELVWKNTDPISTDAGIKLIPTMSFKDCPDDLGILFVPGGTAGTLKIMGDAEVMAFLKSRGEKSDYVTSVCTGALVLGAAGLLNGYKATTHWTTIETLKVLGATPVNERVVHDRNRFTGGGVTAGIDFGLTVAAEIKDENYAKLIQLVMEYAPAPPFKCGNPAEAGEKVTEHTRTMFARFINNANAAAKNARAAW